MKKTPINLKYGLERFIQKMNTSQEIFLQKTGLSQGEYEFLQNLEYDITIGSKDIFEYVRLDLLSAGFEVDVFTKLESVGLIFSLLQILSIKHVDVDKTDSIMIDMIERHEALINILTSANKIAFWSDE